MAMIGILFGMIFSSISARGDLPPPAGYHQIKRCVTIDNLDQFPNLVFIAIASGATGNPAEGKIILPGACIDTYKFNEISLYFSTKKKVETIDLKNLVLNASGKPESLKLLMKSVPFRGETVTDLNPVVAEQIKYSVECHSDEDCVLSPPKSSHDNSGSGKSFFKRFLCFIGMGSC